MANGNPDILSCLSNLSNDEIFTPPELANKMLDMLPPELFEDPNVKFLDPACKSGVFLREITKRLVVGLERAFPDLQQRVDHILHNQVYGIAITELTSQISRRSLYCSKYPHGEYSISKFETSDGNIAYKRIQHTWNRNKCKYCGANIRSYNRGDDLESHAYDFIHLDIKEIFDMKFDVIISNPPYHLSTGSDTSQATPLYDKFFAKAKALNPRYIVMIIPARWYAGGLGLDNFRESMLSDTRIKMLVDFPNAKDCFPGVSIGGGVCYFLWDSNYAGKCKYICNYNNTKSTEDRDLNEFSTFIRYNEALSIIRKVKNVTDREKDGGYLNDLATSLSPFGIDSSYRGSSLKLNDDDCVVYSSGGQGFIPKSDIKQGVECIDKYKIMVSKLTCEHASEPNKEGRYRVFSKLQILGPNEVCTFSYFIIGCYDNLKAAENLLQYLKTKFVRYLLLQTISSINLSSKSLCYIPKQDFSVNWKDKDLYEKYRLSDDEIKTIEDIISPME